MHFYPAQVSGEPSTARDSASRAAFEEWCRSWERAKPDLERFPDEDYRSIRTAEMWMSWDKATKRMRAVIKYLADAEHLNKSSYRRDMSHAL